MALRTRYGYNCQVVNWAKVGELCPFGYVDVVPGETISGTVSVNLYSEPTKRQILTRMYADGYAYYIPYRLLFEDWPKFISEPKTTVELPYVTDLFGFNFERKFVLTSDDITYDRNVAFIRRAYNMITEKYFKEDDNWPATQDLTNRRALVQRSSTLETSFIRDGDQ